MKTLSQRSASSVEKPEAIASNACVGGVWHQPISQQPLLLITDNTKITTSAEVFHLQQPTQHICKDQPCTVNIVVYRIHLKESRFSVARQCTKIKATTWTRDRVRHRLTLMLAIHENLSEKVCMGGFWTLWKYTNYSEFKLFLQPKNTFHSDHRNWKMNRWLRSRSSGFGRGGAIDQTMIRSSLKRFCDHVFDT